MVSDGHPVATGDRVHAGDVLAALPELPILHEVAARLGAGPKDPVGRIASAVELALESLYLTRKPVEGHLLRRRPTVYG